MKYAKRILTALLIVCMLFCFAPAAGAGTSGQVASGSAGEFAVWSIDGDGTLTVRGTGAISSGLTDSDPYLREHKYDIYRIRVEAGIETIGNSAFIGCLFAGSVSLPEGLKTIGSYAFWNAGIRFLSIPDSVTSLGSRAFGACHSLEAAYLGRGLRELPAMLFTDTGSLAEVFIGKNTVRVGSGAFSGAGGLKTVYYEGSAQKWSAMETEEQNENLLLAARAYGCTDQRYGVFQEEIYLEYLAYTVKWGRAWVTRVRDISGTVTVPETLGGFPVYGIEAYAADFCPEITVFELPSTLAEIGLPFADQCFGLRRIEVSPENPYYSSIDGVLFNKDASVLIRVPCYNETQERDEYGYPLYRVPASVVRIEPRAFSRHYGSMAVSIPAEVADIAATAFAENERLLYFDVSPENPVYASRNGVLFDKEIKTLIAAPDAMTLGTGTVREYTLPDTVERVKESAFEHSLLKKVVFPASLRVIENFAFRRSELEEAVFLGEVEEIGTQAFWDCETLASVTMPRRITRRLGHQAFYDTPWFNALPDGPVYINNAFYTWKGDFPETRVFSVKDGTTVLADDCLPENDSVACVTSLELPDCIEYIGRGVFWWFKGLTEVRLPANTKEIGSYAFYECSGLKTVWLNSRLEKICGNAFFCYFSHMNIGKTFYPGTRAEFSRITVEKENDALLANLICLGDHTAHTWDAGVPLSTPSCTQAGETLYTCTVCGETKTEAVPALGHDLVIHEAKAPTCTEPGWDAYEACARCDYTTYAEKAALGHELVSHEAKDPTCTEPGWDAYETCARCDYTTCAQKAALGHAFGEWTVLTPATVTEEGEVTRVCARCGAAETGVIPVLPQTYSTGDVDGDGRVTAADARLALRRAVGLEKYPADSMEYLACDVDRSGTVDTADARIILRVAVGLQELPVKK